MAVPWGLASVRANSDRIAHKLGAAEPNLLRQ